MIEEALLEIYAAEAWAALVEFDRVAGLRARVQWGNASSTERVALRSAAESLLAGASAAEVLTGHDHELFPGGEPVELDRFRLARVLIVRAVVLAAARRESASAVANRALRERDALRVELRPELELLERRLGGAAKEEHLLTSAITLKGLVNKLIKLGLEA